MQAVKDRQFALDLSDQNVHRTGSSTVSETLTPPGLLYGYGVYTTFRWPLPYQRWQPYLTRLVHNAAALKLELPDTFEALLLQALDRHGSLALPIVRVTLFADVLGYTDFFQRPDENAPTLRNIPTRCLITLRSAPAMFSLPELLPDFTMSALDSFQVSTLWPQHYERPNPTIKHLAMADSILLKRDALRHGYNDVLFLNKHNRPTECSTSNFFWMTPEGLHTADPDHDGCLDGITRQRVLTLSADSLFPEIVDVEAKSLDRISNWVGAFCTNAVQGIVPVTRVGDMPVFWRANAWKQVADWQARLIG